MMGSFLTRALVLVLGYAYPAYECYKTVELNNPGIEQLRFWCQYWILVALLTVFERVGDAFISWLPMYSEAKLAFFVYLWYPKTKGTTYVYDTFFRPYVSKHENEIDRNLLELRTRAGDIVVLYWQKAAIYGQTRFFEILQYVASQSQTSSARPVQQQVRQAPPAVPPRQSSAAVVPPPRQVAAAASSDLPPSSPSKSSQVEDAVPKTTLGSNNTSRPETAAVPIAAKQDAVDEAASTSVADPEGDPPAGETAMEEAVRVTRARLRKRVAGGPTAR